MLITKETASEFGKRSGQARRAAPLKSVPPGFKIVPAVDKPSVEPVPTGDHYADLVLARVRVQLDLVNERLTEQLARPTIDAQAIDRLAAAQTRLSEQERILAGRPLPGSRKPGPDKPTKARPAQEPDFEPQTPQQVVPSVSQPIAYKPEGTPPVQVTDTKSDASQSNVA